MGPAAARESPAEAVETAVRDLEGSQARTNACVAFDAESARRRAAALGDGTGPLWGMPFVVKDAFDLAGVESDWCSRARRLGAVDCAFALGFEKMERGSPAVKYADRADPLSRHLERMNEIRPPEESPFAPRMFGNAGRDHMQRYGTMPEHFAWIAWKNHRHSVDNPYAQFQVEYSLEEILSSRRIHAPLTKLQCSPTSDGAAAAVVASERFVEANDLWDGAIEIAGQAMTTDFASSFDATADCMTIVGADMSREAARQAYEEAGVGAAEVDVCELHDCFSTNELLTYEALDFAATGEAAALVEARATTHGGGGPVVNASGGLISKGHPLGATGLAQCSELVWQLRGEAGRRQVDGAKVALQHNIGLGGAAVVTVYTPPER